MTESTLEDRANACAIRALALIRPREGVDAAESFASLRAAIAEFAKDEVKRALPAVPPPEYALRYLDTIDCLLDDTGENSKARHAAFLFFEAMAKREQVNAAAAEFLRSHGQCLFETIGGSPRCEIDLELALVMRKLGERVDDGSEQYELETGSVTLDEECKRQPLPPRCKCDRCNGSGTDPDDRKGNTYV